MPFFPSAEGSERKVGLRLLSLDGGGIRGLSELIIIEEIMERVKDREGLHATPIPADYFDLIGGTSTGGLIAIMLGRLRLSAATAIEKYEALAGNVFSEKKPAWKDGTFKAKRLERAIQDVVRDTLGAEGPDALMCSDDGSRRGCKAFVCTLPSTDVTHGTGPSLFRTYEVVKNREYNCKIWEAARATTAAPTFFKRIKIGPKGSAIEYIDAGLGYNNPIKQLVAEGARVFGDTTEVDCLVSIGTGAAKSTGYEAPNTFQKWLPLKLVGVLKAMVTDCSTTAEEMAIQYKNIPDTYHRFNVDRGLNEIAMEEWKKLSHVRQHTKQYLRLTEIDHHLEKVVDALTGTPNRRGCEIGNLAHAIPSSIQIVYSNMPTHRVAHLVIRRGLISEMDRHLTKTPPVGKPIVLLGMGGAGKTQLALTYCQKLVDSGKLIATLWVDASSPISVAQSFGAIANTISRTWLNTVSDDNTIMFVRGAISTWGRPWLMVFDNFDNPAAFKEKSIYHYLPDSAHGIILFTSRNSSTTRLGIEVMVSDMSKEECLELLLLKAPPYTEYELAEGSKISEALGCLALAIDQAGAFIRAQGLGLEEFIPYYNKKKETVFNDPPDLWEYSKKLSGSEKETRLSVFTTWELSVEQLTGSDADVLMKNRFLSFAAFFDNATISERYFRSYFEKAKPKWMYALTLDGEKWDSDAFHTVLVELRKLSLIQSLDREGDESKFALHPLISDWGKLRLAATERQEILLEAIEALTCHLQATPQTNVPLKARQETTLHLKKLCQHDQDYLNADNGSNLTDSTRSIVEFANFYLGQGLAKEAVVLYKRAVKTMKRSVTSEDDNGELLETLLKLATAYRRTGKYSDARATGDELRNLAERTVGNDHPTVLSMMHESAELSRHEGQYDKAEQLHAECLARRELVLGLTHPDTLESVQNMAEALRRRGKFESAESYQKRALEGYKERFGAMDSGLFLGYHQLGAIMRDNAQYAEAEEMHRQALSGRTQVLGPDHHDTLNSLNNLGLVLRDEKKYEEAEKTHRLALAGRQRNLGEKHPQTITSMHNLARVLQDQGKNEEAEVLQKEAIARYTEVLGENHPYTLTSSFNLASLLLRLGDVEAAKGLHEQVLVQRESRIGPEHPDTLTSLMSLAEILARQKQYSAAAALMQRCYDGRRKVLKENHPQIEECSRALQVVQERLVEPKL